MKSKITAIILATIMTIPTVSFADTNKLTYQTALDKAIKNNLQLERTSEVIDEIDDTLTQGIPIIEGQQPNKSQAVINQSIQYQSLLDNEKITKMKYDAQKDAIQVNLKNIFLKIEYLEKNEKMLEEKLANTRQNQSINTIRYQNGVMSKIDFENAELEIEKLKNAQKENKLQLELSYKDLDNIMNTKNTQKIKYEDVKYQTIASTGISKESAVGRAISEAPTIIEQNSYIKILEERIKYDLLDKSQTSLPREEMSTNVKLEDVNLRINKQTIEDTVLEVANNIENMEVSIKNMENQIQTMEKQSKNMKKLVDLGFKTKIELENLNIKIEDMKLQLENLKNNHYILLERYKKPYLLSLKG